MYRVFAGRRFACLATVSLCGSNVPIACRGTESRVAHCRPKHVRLRAFLKVNKLFKVPRFHYGQGNMDLLFGKDPVREDKTIHVEGKVANIY